MKIFGQPEDYSEILQRVFWFSLATGVLCTAVLAKASPEVQEFIGSISAEADVGPVKSIKVLYVLVPGIIAVLSRIIKLHDRISDILGFRLYFDTNYFLYPLCRGVGVPVSARRRAAIRKARDEAMYQTVYKYAGFKHPIIDIQLVRTAADNWGWFWVLVESSFLLVITAIILAWLKQWYYMTACLSIVVIALILMLVQWLACIRSATPQVHAILSDASRVAAIRDYFQPLGDDTRSLHIDSPSDR